MVKVTFSPNFGKFYQARLKRISRQALLTPQTVKNVRSVIIRQIKSELKLPSDQRVKSLAVSTVKRRRRLAEVNNTDRFYNPFKSNLTFTGRFLKSIKGFASSNGRGRGVNYVFKPTGNHRGYKNLNGSRGKTVPNSVIGQGLIASGRDYTVLGSLTQSKIRKLLVRRVKSAIRRNLRF